MRATRPFFLLALTLTACATRPPDPILDAPAPDLSLSEVAAKVSAYVGQRVRWGGRIAGVENRSNETWLDVVARPLDGNGRPHTSDQSLGRFIARVDGFLDPAVYANGRAVTVAGSIDGTLTRPIGDYPYIYVIVKADATRLWEPVDRPLYYYRDPFYDPFYDPFWPRWYPFFPRW
jgi:outer membrane lipoprotein